MPYRSMYAYLLSTLLISGCVGTLDSAIFVLGSVAADKDCSVELRQSNTKKLLQSKQVSGEYDATFIVYPKTARTLYF